MAIVILAIFALVIALEATGHVVFRGRLILLRGVAAVDVVVPRACQLAELAQEALSSRTDRTARIFHDWKHTMETAPQALPADHPGQVPRSVRIKGFQFPGRQRYYEPGPGRVAGP
jgi:hypothetical protein